MSDLLDRPAADSTGPDAEPDPALQVPRKVSRINPERLAVPIIAAVVALNALIVVREVLAWGGIMGSFLLWLLMYLFVNYAIVRSRQGKEIALDRTVTSFVWAIGAGVCALLAWMLSYPVVKGFRAVAKVSFWTQDLSASGPMDPGGGASHAIVGSLEQVGIATLLVVPIAVMTAVYLHEIRGRAAKPLRFIIESMTGLPSIVAGLLIFTIWANGRGFSGMAGSAALAILMLPTVARTTEEVLRTVPDNLREAALALGSPQWKVVLKTVLPTARAGIITAIILGIARAAGETAPLILTSFGSDTFSINPFHGPQASLPLFVFQLIRQPNAVQIQRAWGGMLVLLILVLVLFTFARWFGARGEKTLRRNR